jgi:hypothetical protein
MRYEIKSLGVWSFVRISFFLNLIVGFLIGLVYAAFLGVILTAAGSVGELPFNPSALGPLLLILLPVIFAVGSAVLNTLMGVIIIVAYNLIARMVGGFEMDLDPVQAPVATNPPPQVPPTAPPPPPGWNPPPPPPQSYGPPRNSGSEQS